jgi:hypothetical protein
MAALKDFGLQYVYPERVNIDQPITTGWQTSKDSGGGTPREDFERGLANAGEVKSLIEKGYDKDDFHRLSQSSDPREKALGDSYGMYWGDRPIQVTKNEDGMFTSDNGAHRLDVAQARGERSVPMRVYAPADDTEFAGKDYDAARHPQDKHEAQEGKKMGREGEGGYRPEQQDHHPLESRESGDGVSNREIKPQLDAEPRQRENLHQGQAHGDQMKDSAPREVMNEKHGADAPANSDASAHGDAQRDAMDGSDDAKPSHAAERNDAMDGAGDSTKSEANHTPQELPEMKGDL